ncbi:MAG: AroM family protein [Blautia massiliensis (ex Durand et al. 2017)]
MNWKRQQRKLRMAWREILIVLDCIGYTSGNEEDVRRKTGKKVVLPRTLLARVVSELTDI